MGRKSKYDASFKSKVVIEALKEDSTLPELVKKYGIAPKQIQEWKSVFLANSASVFDDPTGAAGKELKKVTEERDKLLKKVGQLTLEVDFFAAACAAHGLNRK